MKHVLSAALLAMAVVAGTPLIVAAEQTDRVSAGAESPNQALGYIAPGRPMARDPGPPRPPPRFGGHRDRHDGKRRFRRPHFPIIVERERRVETRIVEVPVETPPPEKPETAPPPPPDPRGTFRRLPARGTGASRPVPEPGAVIAAGRPLVLLDWRAYALPEPGPGQSWVRLGRAVLLIDLDTREVIAAGPDGAQPPG